MIERANAPPPPLRGSPLRGSPCPNDFALREQKDPKREETIMWASRRRLQLKKELENSPDATATILGF
jgi:hypothetical protein